MVDVDRLAGMLLGTAVGDAIGVPYEGMPRRLTLPLAQGRLGHRFLPGRGMVSDDTEHAAFTVEALSRSGPDPDRFRVELARGFRRWLATMPAGVGCATLRSGARVCLGVDPSRSGVDSAGNGPAMRAPAIGVLLAHDERARRACVHASTAMTHNHPSARAAARTLADLSAFCAREGRMPSLDELERLVLRPHADHAWDEAARVLVDAVDRGSTVTDMALALCGPEGVSGYVCHSVPVAMYAALRHPGDMARAVTEGVACGGDTDSVAATAGAIVGAASGTAGVPDDLARGVLGPWDATALASLAHDCRAFPAATHRPWKPDLLAPARSVGFLLVALGHAFHGLGRRALGIPFRA